MKRFVAFCCAFLLTLPFGVGAAETTPDALVKTTSEEIIQVIRTVKDKKQLRELAEQKVLPHFDFRMMTQLAVGQHWRQASEAQRKALEDNFRTLLVNTYTTSMNIAATGKESVEVKPLEMKSGDNDVIVRTVVRTASRPAIPVDYRMARTPNGWKVYDVIVENLSLVTNYRSSFASEINRSGIDGLVKALESKNRELAQAG